MRVDRGSRGAKKGSIQSRDGLVVTVPNPETAECRLKPPVVSSHPRKIVLNQNKTDLDKVTVKSLDEIKREKEERERLKQSSVVSSLSAANSVATCNIPNGGSTCRTIASNRPDVYHSPVVATHAGNSSAASVSGVKAKLPLKKLTVCLKPLSNFKLLNGKSRLLASPSRPNQPREVTMDMDNRVPEQDFDLVEEDSDDTEALDEELLLQDDEEEQGLHSHKDSNESLNFDTLSGFTDTTPTLSEPEDDEISLHPDDSLFDDEDDLSGSSERQGARSLGRRLGNETKDLRSRSGEKQIRFPEGAVKSEATTADKPDFKQEERKGEIKGTGMIKDRTDSGHRRSDRRDKNLRKHSFQTSASKQGKRGRIDKKPDGKKNIRVQYKHDIPRRGAHVSRQGQRKGSGHNVGSNLGGLLATIGAGSGDGLLPIPNTASLPVDVVNNVASFQAVEMLNYALQQNIQQSIQDTVDLLTNPPPVPGETTNRFTESLKQPSRLAQDNWALQGSDRQQNHLQGGKNAGTQDRVAFSKTQTPSQHNNKRQDIRPKWSQQPLSGTKHTFKQDEIGSDSSVGAPETVELADCGINVNRRQVNHPSSSSHHCDPQGLLSKRKSSFQDKDETHGSKILIRTSPDGLPQPDNMRARQTYPKPLCSVQLQTGKCLDNHCQCWHLSKAELEEQQKSQTLEQKSQVQLVEGQAVEQVPVLQQQCEDDTLEVSLDVVNSLLQEDKLGSAWQVIDRLRRMGHPPELHILQRVLYLCSKHKEQPDVAAQVACKAFDMIGRMVPHHNRHSYETLIKALCHSGQYIRAYEMLDVMKKNGHLPTYEVFLDLVQASAKDPDWAFNLVGEIKQAGVFRSKICNDLILLGCSSGEMFVERTFLLFQDAQQENIQMSPDAISAFLLFLLQTNHLEKVISILPSIPGSVPLEILKPAMLNATQNADWTEMIIVALSVIPPEKLTELGADVCNSFLSNCCQNHGDNASFAQRIYSLMQENGIPVLPQAINDYLIMLSKTNITAAFELFIAVSEGPQVLDQPQILEGGLNALSVALNNDGLGADMLRVVHFMLECGIQPVDSVLQSGVEHLDKEENYKGIYQFFKQLETASIVPPFLVYKAIISSLEKWGENPTASSEPYVSMRRAYPAGQLSESATKEGVVEQSEIRGKYKTQVCQYFFKPKGCFLGENCRFLHPAVSPEDCSLPPPTQSFLEPTAQVAHDSITDGGRVTLSTTNRAPPKPFVPQAQAPQEVYVGRPAVVGQTSRPMESLQTETLPFFSQKTGNFPTPEITNEQLTQNQPHVAPGAAVGRNTKRKGTCWYFASPQGCRKGDKCQFIHDTSTVPALKHPSAPLPVPLPGSSGSTAPETRSGTPFVLRGAPSLPGQPAGGSSFGNFNSQQNSAFVARAFSSVHPRPFFKPPSMVSHHFQLASANAFGGTNPFSPSLSVRTRSMDGFGEPKIIEQAPRAHSAPIVPQIRGESCFQFPSRTNPQFYLPRIKHAGQHQSWEDLGLVYISMKNEEVEMDTPVMKAFYQAFQTHSADAIGDRFDQFASKVRACLEKEPLADSNPESSPSSFLDVNDKCFFGEIGVALMSYCHQKKLFSQGYNVLHVLHNFSINYSLYTGEFGIQQRPLSTTEVSLTAADICLHLDTPASTSALEVLRGTNYALPAPDSGKALTPEEAGWRRRVIDTLCHSFIAENQLTFVNELLSEAGDADVFGRNELKILYNKLLVNAIDNRELDFAGEVLKSMDYKLISRDKETVRAMVKGFGEAGRMPQAKQHFISGCLSGFYPNSFKEDNPWTVVIGTSFSALESQFCLESHLQRLYRHIEELARKSGSGALDETNYHPLRVVVESDEVTSSRSKYMKPDEIIRCVREMVCTVLTDEFNPPLSCQPQSNDQEVVVDALSLKRWMCANAASGRSKRAVFPFTTFSGNSTSMHSYLQPGVSRGRQRTSNNQRPNRQVCVGSINSLNSGQGQLQPQSFGMRNHGSQRGRAQPISSNRAMLGRGRAKTPKTA
ncbi:uncharacterized protein LOC114973339 isoform X2 [Acropora millepora]|uniref:uncharacterized protein LOC114973339 isoform X2 n=1 Tax=Acropora millepora TaxID=45264 RepID=UPI001CF3795B|nr:uncharacterized protein LOC114973339 isoform X2 [Acropora millepora]